MSVGTPLKEHNYTVILTMSSPDFLPFKAKLDLFPLDPEPIASYSFTSPDATPSSSSPDKPCSFSLLFATSSKFQTSRKASSDRIS